MRLEVEFLGDHIGCDHGFTDVPHRSAWEGISWVKDSTGNAFAAVLPQLQNISPPKSVQEAQQIVSSSLLPSVKQTFALITKVATL